jgi:hypothetical protein
LTERLQAIQDGVAQRTAELNGGVSSARRDETSDTLYDPVTTDAILVAAEKAEAARRAEADQVARAELARRGLVQADINVRGRQQVDAALQTAAERRAADTGETAA